MKFEWEELGDNYSKRAKVHGGWIVVHYTDVVHETEHQGMAGGWDWRSSMVFVPDPKHEWEL